METLQVRIGLVRGVSVFVRGIAWEVDVDLVSEGLLVEVFPLFEDGLCE
jgi:hypothetical protein